MNLTDGKNTSEHCNHWLDSTKIAHETIILTAEEPVAVQRSGMNAVKTVCA
ncbi:MAG: hypothetical protein NTZ39_01615 [Methanoregula sp.]|nr:hypothetical protein [Methanoregula sp.]